MGTFLIVLIAMLGGIALASVGFMVAVVYLVARDTNDRWGSDVD